MAGCNPSALHCSSTSTAQHLCYARGTTVVAQNRAFSDWNFFGESEEKKAEKEAQLAEQQAILARRRNKGAQQEYFERVKNSRQQSDEERKMWKVRGNAVRPGARVEFFPRSASGSVLSTSPQSRPPSL